MGLSEIEGRGGWRVGGEEGLKMKGGSGGWLEGWGWGGGWREEGGGDEGKRVRGWDVKGRRERWVGGWWVVGGDGMRVDIRYNGHGGRGGVERE